MTSLDIFHQIMSLVVMVCRRHCGTPLSMTRYVVIGLPVCLSVSRYIIQVSGGVRRWRSVQWHCSSVVSDRPATWRRRNVDRHWTERTQGSVTISTTTIVTSRYATESPRLTQISLPWQLGSAPQHFAWFHWICHPRQPPIIPKHLRSVSHTSRLIGDFMQKLPRFRCHGNKDQPHDILHGSIESAIPENPLVDPNISGLSAIQAHL